MLENFTKIKVSPQSAFFSFCFFSEGTLKFCSMFISSISSAGCGIFGFIPLHFVIGVVQDTTLNGMKTIQFTLLAIQLEHKLCVYCNKCWLKRWILVYGVKFSNYVIIVLILYSFHVQLHQWTITENVMKKKSSKIWQNSHVLQNGCA